MYQQFHLDPRLEKDSLFLADLSLCQLRLMNNKNYPWFLLIPRQEGLREICDLKLTDQTQLMSEINQVSLWLKEYTGCDKLNIASFGNKVSQLHIHIISRFETDLAWPEPIWSKLQEPQPYGELELTQWRRAYLESSF